jgi:zinc/manganese transport system substrate-binding protein
VQNVVGDAATVEVLLPLGADPHDFQVSAQQVASLLRADLVVANGLDLEDQLADVLDGAEDDGANLLYVAELLDPLPFAADDADGALDPHVWLDPLRMADAARLIAEELGATDASVDWATRAEAYAAELVAADTAIAEILDVVPPTARKLVTNHDALGYFADRYGFTIVDTVIPGGATIAEPSSAELAELIAAIEREGVRAIFAETTEPTTIAEAVARDADIDVDVVELFTGSLGAPGSDAETLIDMLLTNAQRIADALG